jgi:hypothetical protein
VTIKHKVGQLDVSAARFHVVTIVKPALRNSAERAPSVLNRMAARGPRYRVGLVPSATSRRWDFSDEPGSWCSQALDISGQPNMQEILDDVVGRRFVVPISVSQAGEYLCVACDHGLGDSHFIWEVCAALTHGNTDTGFVEPLAAPTMTNPLFSALFHATKSPRLFVRAAIGLWKPGWSFFLSHVIALVNRPRVVPSTPAGDQDERYVAVWSKSAPGFIEEVRRYRDSNHPSASVNAILMLSICRALQECGASLHDELEVLTDLRRFLPRHNITFSNFYTVTRINIATQPSVEEFSASLRLAVGSLNQLFTLAGFIAVNRVRMLFARRTRKTEPPLCRPAKSAQSILTISDVSKLPALAKVAWTRPDDAEIASASQPAGQSHISIFINITPNGSVQLTASFYASHIDKLLVARGLSRALSSVALTQRPEPVSEPCTSCSPEHSLRTRA